MNKRLFRKLSLRLSACLALRSGRTVCPHGLEKKKGMSGLGIPFFYQLFMRSIQQIIIVLFHKA